MNEYKPKEYPEAQGNPIANAILNLAEAVDWVASSIQGSDELGPRSLADEVAELGKAVERRRG